MARHMPISAVARHTGLSWDAVKAIECAHLAETIPIPRPQTLTGIRYLGVDEVPCAKGQSYFTLVYDLSPGPNYGRILWVKEGRTGAVLLEFLDALSQECAVAPEACATWRISSSRSSSSTPRTRRLSSIPKSPSNHPSTRFLP